MLSSVLPKKNPMPQGEDFPSGHPELLFPSVDQIILCFTSLTVFALIGVAIF